MNLRWNFIGEFMLRVTYDYSSMSVKLNSPHSLSLEDHYWISSELF